jgi:hypothetical protein
VEHSGGRDFTNPAPSDTLADMPDSTLLAFWDHVRSTTLRRLEGVVEKEARWKTSGLHNTILWHAGHALIVTEWLIMDSLGRRANMPPGWFELFNWNSRPAETRPEQWPPLEKIVLELQAQYSRMRGILSALTEEQLEAAVPVHDSASARSMIAHAIQDEACHCGEIHLLRKLYAKENLS